VLEPPKVLLWGLANSGAMATAGCIALAFAAAVLARGGPRDSHKRGTLIQRRDPHRPRARLSALWGEPSPLTLARAVVPSRDETKHFKLIGTTGTGKSTAILELMRGALARGDRAVITDPDAGYYGEFFDQHRGDVILNPFERHSVRWDPFAEIRRGYDVEQLASGLIPDTEDANAREWRGYARTFLAAVTRRCQERGLCGASELWRLVTVASSDELRPIVSGTPAQPFLEPDNARMFCSIRSVAGSVIAALEYVQAQRSGAFSVRDWVCGGTGVLFIPYRAAQIAALRSIIATWMRLAIFEAMSQPDGDQRLWFVVDELDALGAIDGLKDALARLRKFGGRCVLGFQSIAQVSSTYGAAGAQTIVENCGNTLILRCSGSENGGTSQFASRLIGEREVLRRQASWGRDGGGTWNGHGGRRTRQVTEQRTTELAVLASQLEQLPDLHGYLKTASSRGWTRVALTPRATR
jgi:type IV secretory pathway TraG/TraD family ATPase VirD4